MASRSPDKKFDNWFGKANGAEHAEQRDKCGEDGLLIPVGESTHFELAQFLNPALDPNDLRLHTPLEGRRLRLAWVEAFGLDLSLLLARALERLFAHAARFGDDHQRGAGEEDCPRT